VYRKIGETDNLSLAAGRVVPLDLKEGFHHHAAGYPPDFSKRMPVLLMAVRLA